MSQIGTGQGARLRVERSLLQFRSRAFEFSAEKLDAGLGGKLPEMRCQRAQLRCATGSLANHEAENASSVETVPPPVAQDFGNHARKPFGKAGRAMLPPMRILIATLLLALAGFPAAPARAADPAAVAKIHGGIVDCVGCNLSGADLTNTCVKEHDLHGANFDGANATLMCMSFANFTNASFRGTELSGANLAGAKMDGADLTGAKTSITSFLGTDLTRVKGLTQKQLDVACGDSKTKLPPGLKVHTCK